MPSSEVQTLIGTALINQEFSKDLLEKKRLTLLREFELSDKEQEVALSIEATSIQEFATRLYKKLVA